MSKKILQADVCSIFSIFFFAIGELELSSEHHYSRNSQVNKFLPFTVVTSIFGSLLHHSLLIPRQKTHPSSINLPFSHPLAFQIFTINDSESTVQPSFVHQRCAVYVCFISCSSVVSPPELTELSEVSFNILLEAAVHNKQLYFARTTNFQHRVEESFVWVPLGLFVFFWVLQQRVEESRVFAGSNLLLNLSQKRHLCSIFEYSLVPSFPHLSLFSRLARNRNIRS